MSILVTSVEAFVIWLGLFVNMKQSYISAIDLSNSQPVTMDSITLDRLVFSPPLPDQAQRHLGVRMTMAGNFEKACKGRDASLPGFSQH